MPGHAEAVEEVSRLTDLAKLAGQRRLRLEGRPATSNPPAATWPGMVVAFVAMTSIVSDAGSGGKAARVWLYSMDSAAMITSFSTT